MLRAPSIVMLCAALAVVAGCSESETNSTAPDVTSAAAADPALAAVDAWLETHTASGRLDKARANWKFVVPEPPWDATFAPGRTYFWNLRTNMGPIRIRFLHDVAPKHVINFIALTKAGFFDGLKFHRIIQDFMAQGGDPAGNGMGSPGYRFAGEFRPGVGHDKPGMLSMANSGPGTDGSQFFLTFVPTPQLDGRHTVFGEVVDGQATLKKIEEYGAPPGAPPGKDQPTATVVIEEASITVE